MRNYMLLATCITLSACGGTIFSAEHRAQSTQNLFLNTKACPSNKFVWITENKNNEQGWKSVREYACKGSALASKNGSLDGKTYDMEEMKELGKKDPYVSNFFYP